MILDMNNIDDSSDMEVESDSESSSPVAISSTGASSTRVTFDKRSEFSQTPSSMITDQALSNQPPLNHVSGRKSSFSKAASSSKAKDTSSNTDSGSDNEEFHDAPGWPLTFGEEADPVMVLLQNIDDYRKQMKFFDGRIKKLEDMKRETEAAKAQAMTRLLETKKRKMKERNEALAKRRKVEHADSTTSSHPIHLQSSSTPSTLVLTDATKVAAQSAISQSLSSQPISSQPAIRHVPPSTPQKPSTVPQPNFNNVPLTKAVSNMPDRQADKKPSLPIQSPATPHPSQSSTTGRQTKESEPSLRRSSRLRNKQQTAVQSSSPAPSKTNKPSTAESSATSNKGAFKPYQSPLNMLGISHIEDTTTSSSSAPTDVNKQLCAFEMVGGTCNDRTCTSLHFRDFAGGH
ncbi:uncharacterized protein BYT42DRAFT_553502 [Radiomyces spectabilis]|uniref:uncharacterized protein n=1 Tax=Radiomyces spectabilis TaxID=64574 RepID=UPI00221E5285|nr:uncharacterized protein BYT42DRAFT_553502 [Radiomyces spectabilis]KAI8394133.1 hypothetical protein BYT42DRAFT_553502 [Radiomyces spectabilis]